jgi:hypothetical protein
MVLSHATQAHGILLIATRPVPNSGQQYTWYLLLAVPPDSFASLVNQRYSTLVRTLYLLSTKPTTLDVLSHGHLLSLLTCLQI